MCGPTATPTHRNDGEQPRIPAARRHRHQQLGDVSVARLAGQRADTPLLPGQRRGAARPDGAASPAKLAIGVRHLRRVPLLRPAHGRHCEISSRGRLEIREGVVPASIRSGSQRFSRIGGTHPHAGRALAGNPLQVVFVNRQHASVGQGHDAEGPNLRRALLFSNISEKREDGAGHGRRHRAERHALPRAQVGPGRAYYWRRRPRDRGQS